jgi:hypothetical protein
MRVASWMRLQGVHACVAHCGEQYCMRARGGCDCLRRASHALCDPKRAFSQWAQPSMQGWVGSSPLWLHVLFQHVSSRGAQQLEPKCLAIRKARQAGVVVVDR